MSREQILQDLTDFIATEVLQGQGEGLDAQTALLELGIIDSLSMMSVLSFIESKYGVEVGAEALQPRHFKNLNALTELVIKYQASS